MSDLEQLMNELMQDEEFRKEYDSLEPERIKTRAIIEAHIREK